VMISEVNRSRDKKGLLFVNKKKQENVVS